MPCPKRLRDEQDPDYQDESAVEGKRQRIAIQAARADACERVRQVVRHHFGEELRQREETLMECQSRLHEATQALHLLRYLAVASYYSNKTTQQQARLHPAVKKLVGKQGANNAIHLGIPDTSQLRSRSINLKSTSSNPLSPEPLTSSQTVKSLSKDVQLPMKQPKYVAPKEKASSVVVSPPRASVHKVKKRLLVGNISKWLCEELREGAATHKWMMYVRGPPENPDISNLVEKVRFYLHSSYQPHDVIEVTSSPFHLSRRGWGEFPVRLQIHFQNAENRPLDVIHQLRLDRTYTGLQTLGAETLVDVWLFEEQQIKERTSTVTSTSCQPIKQEVSVISPKPSSAASGGITIKQEPEEWSPAPSPTHQATRSLLKQFNATKTSVTNTTSIVRDCFKNPSTTTKNIDSKEVCNGSTSDLASTIKIISSNQGSLARFLCGQIKVESGTLPVTSVQSNIASKSSAVSSEVLNNNLGQKLDNVRLLQHHDYAKPVNFVENNTKVENSVSSVQVVSGSSLLKSNVKTISDLSLLGGKKIIQLKPVISSNQLKPVPISPKQTNNVTTINNQNKSIQVLNSASILKTVPTNGVNKLANGTKLMLTKGGENSQRVILVKMDKNGKFQQIQQQSSHNLPPLPPLVMIKKPLGSTQITSSIITTSQSNLSLFKPAQVGSNTAQGIKIEPGTSNDNQTIANIKQSIYNSINQGKKGFPQSVLINKQGHISIGGKQIFTIATSSGVNVLMRRPDPEIEKFERLVLDYEQQLKQLECRSVDDADLALGLLLRQLPLIAIKDDAYCQVHPYIIPSPEIFLSWHIGKQRAFEAMRARLVGRLLIAQGFPARKLWDIARWARQHGYSPLPCDPTQVELQVSIKEEKSEWESQTESNTNPPIKPKSSSTYCESSTVLSWLNSYVVDKSKLEEDVIDVEELTDGSVTSAADETEGHSTKDCSESSMPCMAVQSVASDLGIALNDQSATMMTEVGKLLMEDLLRRALAQACSRTNGVPASIELHDVKSALLNRPEFDIFSNQGLGMELDPSCVQSYKI